MAISTAEKEKLFRQFKHSMGAPTRTVELEDETMCTLLELAVEDYAQYVQEWLIEHNWQSAYGMSINSVDLAFAMSVRSIDYVTKYTYAYSKQVGLQTNGPWELKKDYVNIESGRQVYQIPAGREINEVLWMTPPTANRALLSSMGGGYDTGFGGGYSQVGNAGTAGNGGYYIAPAFDVILTAQDMNLKQRMMRSDLVYKITAGPNGTRLLHLLSTPGSKTHFGGSPAGINLTGCQVWYHYYDLGTTGNTEECRAANPDIIMLPNEVPLAKLEYSKFNEPTKTLIRQLFMAECKRTLGRTRGKFGGIVGPPDAERTMDYDTLLTEGNTEKLAVLERLDARLLKLSSTSQLERAAQEAEFLNTAMKFRPMGFYVY